jgi:hypoxanthine phosphoribosyltransferase
MHQFGEVTTAILDEMIQLAPAHLIVLDDIVDTGHTIFPLLAVQHLSLTIISLYVRNTADIDHSTIIAINRVNNDDWLIFPWEIQDLPVDQQA